MKRTTTMPLACLSLVLGCLLLVRPQPASAFPRLGLELGPQWQESADRSFDLVGEDDVWSQLSPALGFAFTPRLGVWLGYRYGGDEAPLFGRATARTALAVHMAEASLQYSVELLDWLRPYARLGGGLVASRLELALDGGEERRDWAYAPSYFFCGGVLITPGFVRELKLRDDGLFSETTLGLRLELGYLWAGELVYDSMPVSARRNEGSVEIRRPDIDLGGLRLGGHTWKMALFALF